MMRGLRTGADGDHRSGHHADQIHDAVAVLPVPDAELMLEDDDVEGVEQVRSDRDVLVSPMPVEGRLMGRGLRAGGQVHHLHGGSRVRKRTRERLGKGGDSTLGRREGADHGDPGKHVLSSRDYSLIAGAGSAVMTTLDR